MNMKTITRINRNARPDCSKYISVEYNGYKKKQYTYAISDKDAKILEENPNIIASISKNFSKITNFEINDMTNKIGIAKQMVINGFTDVENPTELREKYGYPSHTNDDELEATNNCVYIDDANSSYLKEKFYNNLEKISDMAEKEYKDAKITTDELVFKTTRPPLHVNGSRTCQIQYANGNTYTYSYRPDTAKFLNAAARSGNTIWMDDPYKRATEPIMIRPTPSIPPTTNMRTVRFVGAKTAEPSRVRKALGLPQVPKQTAEIEASTGVMFYGPENARDNFIKRALTTVTYHENAKPKASIDDAVNNMMETLKNRKKPAVQNDETEKVSKVSEQEAKVYEPSPKLETSTESKTTLKPKNRKFELTNDTKDVVIKGESVTVSRIKALRKIGDVQKGSIGGYIESEANLGRSGTSWIHDDSIVAGEARITGNTIIEDNSVVTGDIKIMGDSLVTHTTIDGDKLDESVLKDIIVDDQIDKDFVKNVSELSTDEVTL